MLWRMDDDKTFARSLPTIPGYDVTSFLGEGGMAQVYLAEDVQLERPVALKMISEQLSRMDDFRTRFRGEGRIVASFRHPNIVTVFASGQIDGRRYIVMEFIPGGTLAEKLVAKPLSSEESLSVAASMADALAYAHQRRVVHRDFKPANILLTQEGEPVLSDFGIAKSMSSESKTVLGTIMGAPLYMAPEQSLGHAVSYKADVYAWGLVFFEMLTGHLPAREFAVVDTAMGASAIWQSLPKELHRYGRLIARCLNVDPEQRPSAKECADTLSQNTQNSSVAFMLMGVVAAALIILATLLFVTRDRTVTASEAERVTLQSTQTSVPERLPPTISLDGLPPGVQVYVDGQATDERSIDLNGSAGELVLVAEGYAGRVIDLTTSEPQTVTLDPLGLPDAREHTLFANAFFKPNYGAAVIRAVQHLPLVTALGLKAQLPADRNKMVIPLETLVRYRDQGASLALYIVTERNLIDGDLAERAASLKVASEGGYALASFYLALHLKDQSSLRMSESSSIYQRFVGLLDLSEQQGLDVEIVDQARTNLTTTI